VAELFKNPRHPYTESLLKSIPRPDRLQKRLKVIPGIVPSLLDLPPGCKFSNRCAQAFEKCLKEEPLLYEVGPGHFCRCWLYEHGDAA
jgi:oligopeptide/dipeptide ABC transporter ATP-binding protein